uniref:S-adenosyl-L-methionine-dependent methyltransferase n=1 Tax=Chlamydomonas leiostraca TaxID=1034604 RepID=A0A7S0R7Q6_9CHLO|mmetsp:Transcript_15675/g.39079  ORF Transcript_15675/g.39079 Transcript_15675/m.39079 type:complete len:293 (+) Transcript_15675:385-1263(+)
MAAPYMYYTDAATQQQSRKVWSLFNSVEAEALVNALRRWQSSFGIGRSTSKHVKTTVNDPYVRLILDRCLPSEVEAQLCKEPLDRLMQNVIAVRTSVIDEHLLQWSKGEGISQVVILASGFDTRAWRLRWPPGVSLYEVDSAMIMNQKYTALGDIQPNCHRLALIGDVFNLPQVFRSLKGLGFDASKPCMWLVEDVVEYMLPELASEMFATIAAHCCAGSRLIVTLSDVRLRDLLKRYGHAMHLIEDYEPAGVVLNRILGAGWKADMILSGELESKYDVDLHTCLYIVRARK